MLISKPGMGEESGADRRRDKEGGGVRERKKGGGERGGAGTGVRRVSSGLPTFPRSSALALELWVPSYLEG